LTRSRTLRSLFRWALVVLWMAVLFHFSSMSQRPSTPGLHGFRWDDKLQHAGAYAILGALVWWALADMKALRRAIVAVLISAAYGIADELHQSFVPGRECSLFDWVTDAAGATIAVLLLLVFLVFRDLESRDNAHVR
jgi:VanZ family protein